MKDVITILLMIIGIALVMCGLVYGAYLIHPVLCVIVIGFELIAIGKAMIE